MTKNTPEGKVIRFVPRRGSFLNPSIKEIATMSGQLSFLAVSACNFGMSRVGAYCRFANEELRKWLEKNGGSMDLKKKRG